MSDQLDLRHAQIERDPATGRPRRVRGSFPLSDVHADDGGSAAGRFVMDNAAVLELGMGAGTLDPVRDVDTPAGRIVRLQQKLDGLPVLGGEVIVRMDKDESVREIVLEPVTARPMVQDDATSRLTAKKAIAKAKEALDAPELRAEPQHRGEAWVETEGMLRRVHVVLLLTKSPPHDWQVLVDSETGKLVSRRDLIVHAPDGQGLVFDPNPVSTSGNAMLRDPDAGPTCGFTATARALIDNQRVSRTLRDLGNSGGTFRLDGPFARIRDFGAPNTTIPQETSANGFAYSSGDARFEAVNAYYHIDTIQRYLQSLGITHVLNRAQEADPHENDDGGAFFSPGDLGLHFGGSGPCRPDRAEDGHVVLHEYGHAMQHDQVPGWGQPSPVTGRNEARAMGEGFGDFLACSFFAPDHPFLREVFEPWIFGDLGGLRRVDGTKVYPADWTGEEHDDGEIWAAALWNVYRAIGGDSMGVFERRAARDEMVKSVVLSHDVMAPNATMPDGAEALMTTHAALDPYIGKSLTAMLDSFHARGILACDPAADLYISDFPADPGLHDTTGQPFWNSPDLWVRNADDNGTAHQNPEAGQDNWFYARIRNRGTAPARAFVVTFNVKPFAGIEFVYPSDWLPPISAAVGFNLAPGASTVVKAKWPAGMVPPAGTHACWLAQAYMPTAPTPAGKHVWEHNNLAQKNLTVVDLHPDTHFDMFFQLGHLGRLEAETVRLEVIRPERFPGLELQLMHQDPKVLEGFFKGAEGLATLPQASATPLATNRVRLLDPARVQFSGNALMRLHLAADSVIELDAAAPKAVNQEALQRRTATLVEAAGVAAIRFLPGRVAGLPVVLKPGMGVSTVLRLQAPKEAKPGESFEVQVVQRDGQGAITGGITVQINVVG